jgi:hypothetical protein
LLAGISLGVIFRFGYLVIPTGQAWSFDLLYNRSIANLLTVGM